MPYLTIVARGLFALLFVNSALAAPTEGLQRREWKVDGVAREALIHLPADAKEPAPLVFVFHGHGGSSANAARMFHAHVLWPEAVVVYPQGLNTPGRLTDPDGKRSGWQWARGHQGDRDLKFFDAMLESFRVEKCVDEKRVYVTGHSNGGSFTYLLWAERGERIAAVAPSGALNADSLRSLKPKPVLHVAGRKDPLVKFQWQQRMIDGVIALNQCDPAGKPDGEFRTRYESKVNAPVLTYLHDGGHEFPKPAAAIIVEFFKSH